MSHQPQHGILCQHGWSVSDNLVALSLQLQFMCFCPPPVHFNWIQFIRGGILVWSSYVQFFHPKTEWLHNQGHFLKMQIYASYTYIYYQKFNLRGQWSKLSPAKRCCPWAVDTVWDCKDMYYLRKKGHTLTQLQYFEWWHLVLLPWLVKLSPLNKNMVYIPDLEVHGGGPWAEHWQSSWTSVPDCPEKG